VLCAETLHSTLRAMKLTDASVSYATVGARVDEPKQHISEWCNPLSERRPKLHQIAMLGPKLAPAIFRNLAAAIEAAAGTVVTGDLREIALDVQARVGDLARSVNEAWRDRKLTLAEIEEIEARCHATNAETSAALATCANARAELRRTGGSR